MGSETTVIIVREKMNILQYTENLSTPFYFCLSCPYHRYANLKLVNFLLTHYSKVGNTGLVEFWKKDKILKILVIGWKW